MTVTINGTTGIANDGGYTGDGVVFADTTPANTLVTTTGGNVGIGTSSPNGKLDVQISSMDIVGGLGGDFPMWTYRNGSGSWFHAGKSPSADAFIFSTGATPTSNELARIDSSGRMLIGTTTKTDAQRLNIAYDNDTSTGFRMYCNSGTYNGAAIDFLNVGGTRVGYILPSSTGTTYSTSSDYRLKENIAPMQGALSVVQQLKPCTYTWKSDGSDGQGFIAHELQAVVPDCVTGEKDAVDAEGNPQYQGIDTSFLVATLTAAIQEQQAMIASQSEIINAQQAALTALTARVTALEGA